MKVLVIEDSERLRFSLGQALKKSGYTVDAVGDGLEGFDYARFNDYDVILLDLMLPSLDGLTLLKKLRALGKQTHVLILSAKDQVEDRVKGLDLGADDYMIKPFAFDELNARIHTLIRRKYEAKTPEVRLGPVTINTSTKQVLRDNTPIKLTPGEYSILEFLVLNRGRVLSKQQLLDAIHDSDSYAGTNVIEVMICKLRAKVGCNGNRPIIATRRGYGYLVEMEAVS